MLSKSWLYKMKINGDQEGNTLPPVNSYMYSQTKNLPEMFFRLLRFSELARQSNVNSEVSKYK